MKKYFYTFSVLLIVVLPQIVNAEITVPSSGDTGLPGGTATNGNYILPIIENMVGFVAAIIASLAVLMIIVSGIMYMTSGGDSQKAETAKKMLTYSIAGLIVAILA
ncbi:MAG: hypothetical protein U9Q12_04175, partial [Patescibacteria group bacterium]|nr:hypothetical protein [Patescibacteria group bacterium]